MDCSAQLLELYQQWKSLTEKEGAAILASDWMEVRRCQKQKQQLQPQIIRTADLTKNAPSMPEFETRIRECVNELIQLESDNNASLEKRLESTRKEITGLDRTSHRLRQVHKSYVPAPGNVWDQYS